MGKYYVGSLASFLILLAGHVPASAEAQYPDYAPDLHRSVERQISDYVARLHDHNPAYTHSGPNPAAYYGLGLAYHFEGKYDEAIENYDKAIGWDHGYADAYEARGDAYAAMGKPDAAAESYRLAGSVTQDTPGELNGRCWERAIRGAPLDRALADCTAALKEDPDNFDYRQSRCFVYFRAGMYDDAISDCTAALTHRPRMSEALYVRGLAELGKGNEAAGRTDLAAAMDANYRIEKIYALYGIKPPESSE